MIRATRSRSRSTNHWKGGWMVRLGPKRLALRLGVPRSMESDFHSFFRRLFFSFFFDLGSILEGFGRPKHKPKLSFGSFFFDILFEHVSVLILGGLLEPRNLKNQ